LRSLLGLSPQAIAALREGKVLRGAEERTVAAAE